MGRYKGKPCRLLKNVKLCARPARVVINGDPDPPDPNLNANHLNIRYAHAIINYLNLAKD